MQSLTAITALPPAVHSYVGAFAARRRWVTLLWVAGVALVVASVWLAAWALVDRLFPLPQAARVALLLANLLFVGVLIWRPVRALLRREIDWRVTAAEIERRNPRFAQRLETVTSQLLAAPQYRGSTELLERLLDQVAGEAATDQPQRLVPFTPALRPWGVLCGIWIAVAGLWYVPWLDLPTLLERQLMPWQQTGPATTTQLEVEPGDTDIVQGQPLRVSALAQRLGDSGVYIRTSSDGISWTSSAMTLGADNRHVFTLASVERDLHYQVIGGDAQSPTYRVRVLRRPAVAQFQMRYSFPAYTERPPALVSNSDGLIEAPVGTETTVTISATEPLQSAVLVVGDERIITEPLPQPQQRQAKLIVRSNQKYDLEMVSAHNIPSAGPSGMIIRAVPDRPPAVQLVLPAQDVRMHPRDTLALPYQAGDDYGIASINASVLLNDVAVRTIALPLSGSPRFAEGTLSLDLSELNVVIGDVVTVSLVAEDRIGQRSTSQASRVLIAPHSISNRAGRRISELKESHRRAQRLVTELAAAAATASPPGGDAAAPLDATRMNRDVAAAGETARLLVRSLLRAIGHSDDPQLATALAGLADQSQVIAAEAEQISAELTDLPQVNDPHRQRIAQWLESARRLESATQTLWHGQEASRLLADRQNLLDAQQAVQQRQRSASDAFRRAMDRARRDLLAGVAEIGLNPLSPDLEPAMNHRQQEAQTLIEQHRLTDLAEAARQWAAQPAQDPAVLQARINTATWAEALRADADHVRATDLRLAEQALRAVAATASTQPAGSDAQLFAEAMANLQRAHRFNRHEGVAPSAPEAQLARRGAEQARRVLSEWARRLPNGSADSIAATERAEELALQANSHTASGNYTAARELDRQRRQLLNPSSQPSTQPSAAQTSAADEPAVRDALIAAQELQRIAEQQLSLQQRTHQADPSDAFELSQRQEELLSAMERAMQQNRRLQERHLEEFSSRSKAMTTVRSIDQRLAGMSEQINDALQLAESRQASASAVAAWEQQAASAPPHQQQATSLQLEEARQQHQRHQRELEATLRALDPTAVQAMATRLEPFAPESEPAMQQMRQQLAPALQALQRSTQAGDLTTAAHAAQLAQQSIAQACDQLMQAHEALATRQPAAAARWFARQAAQTLLRRDSDLQGAAVDQGNATIALRHAAQLEAQRASTARLGALPSAETFFKPSSPNETAARIERLFTRLPDPSASREWGALPQRPGEDLAAAAREADPPGYQDPLRVYFQQISKMRFATEGR